jgi:hypothetical protein
MATKYDPNVLQEYADRFYTRARKVVVRATALGFGGGLAASLVLATVVAWRSPRAQVGAGWLLFLTLAGLALGWAYGREKAFWFRLEAQRTL